MKQKTKNSMRKRVKKTSKGAIFIEKACRRHRLIGKSKRQKHIRKGKAIHPAAGDLARLRKRV